MENGFGGLWTLVLIKSNIFQTPSALWKKSFTSTNGGYIFFRNFILHQTKFFEKKNVFILFVGKEWETFWKKFSCGFFVIIFDVEAEVPDFEDARADELF